MKKVLSLVLAAAMTFGMSAVAFAAEVDTSLSMGFSDKIYTNTTAGTGSSVRMIHNDGSVNLTMPNGDNVLPGTKFTIDEYGIYGAYNDEGYWVQAAVDKDTISYYNRTSDFSRNKVTVKKSVTKGGGLFKDPELKNDTRTYYGRKLDVDGKWVQDTSKVTKVNIVRLQVEFKDPIVSVKEQEFDFKVYLAKSGSKITESEISVTGFQENEKIEVDGDDEVNLSDGQYAKAVAYTKGIKVDTGNGLFVTTNMFEDQKYYAKSEQNEPSNADEDILAQYPEIESIYTLYSINMKSASNVVTFDIDDKYYVYNQDGKYVGMSTDKLPMADKYYLATKKIDMDSGNVDEAPADTDGDTTPVDVDTESPSTGGDDVAVNVNDNPGTGANGFVNVAVVAGMVALAAGAVSMKK